MYRFRALVLTCFLAAGALCAAADAPSKGGPVTIRIGTLPTEDALPLWAAEQLGLTASAGLTLQVITFQSAQERDVALASAAIDGFMGDLIAAASLEAGGVPVTVATLMLGATAAEGRFGIVAAPGSGIRDLKGLSGVPVATSSGTIQEYVMDGLLKRAGVADIRKEEVKKVPVRFELLMSGKVKAAALPEPLLSLAEKQGAVLLADDTSGPNLSQTVLVVSKRFLDRPGAAEALRRLLQVWDRAAERVNADPGAWRATLVEKARLPKPIQESYRINRYPKSQLPRREEVDAVLVWMREKDLLKKPVGYEDLCSPLPK
ncbi:MAG: ABC transporter substrate-binding protein [Deltaproteobacteria bacterium]|nr:ABC transporter substrate-binding protein [Deltaproteobacteria bacterium]